MGANKAQFEDEFKGSCSMAGHTAVYIGPDI